MGLVGRRWMQGAQWYIVAAICAASSASAGDRLLATGGLMSIEGSAGGGLTPWAVIAGLGTNEEVGASGFCTSVKPQDFALESCGIAVGIDNRLELSLDRQRFDLSSVVVGQAIDQTIVGAKVRVFGDVVVDQDHLWPQMALGVQWKDNTSFDLVPKTVGARRAAGLDVYVAATKLWLDGPFGHSWVADVTLRYSEANQLGILGFGGDLGTYHLLPEGSLGIFVTDHLIVGGEYRKKPSNLSAFREDDFKDAFIAYLPAKWLSLTVAYADLGNVADKPGQAGPYFSVQGSY
jgi:Protein of unknown function (DUF3034)